MKEEEVLPVVVMQLGYGGGKAWGVSPDAAVGGVEDGSGVRPSWKAFREEVGRCRFGRCLSEARS